MYIFLGFTGRHRGLHAAGTSYCPNKPWPRTGAKIWDFGDHAVKSDLMSVYAAQLVPDLDGDGVQDVLAVHGGDPLSDPAHRNMYGRIILFR